MSLRDIRFENLRRVSSLRMLFEQAVSARWVTGSEADFQNFVAAAVRATRLDRASMRSDPVRVFVGLVRKKLWHHITAGQEERARAVIAKFRDKTSDRASSREAIERVAGAVSSGHGSDRAGQNETPLGNEKPSRAGDLQRLNHYIFEMSKNNLSPLPHVGV